MIRGALNDIVEKIARISGISKEEIIRRIEAKKERLSGLVSLEGAAQIVAAELGIKFESIKLNIADLLPGMRRINVVGKIVEMYGIKNYSKNDKELKVASFLLADSTDAIRVVLWDTHHIALIEQGKIKAGDTVEIRNAYVRGDNNRKEIHLTNISEISLSNLDIGEVVNKESYVFRLIKELTANAKIKIKANIVQVFKPFVYDFCRECNQRNSDCNHIEKEKRIILPFIVDDGSGAIRCIAFNENASEILKDIGINEIKKDMDELLFKELLGEEFWISGRTRYNDFQDALELVVDEIKQVDVREVIEQLQSL